MLDYFKVLGWPAVALAALLILKDPLKGLLNRVTGASLWGAGLDFAHASQAAEEQSERVARAAPKEDASDDGDEGREDAPAKRPADQVPATTAARRPSTGEVEPRAAESTSGSIDYPLLIESVLSMKPQDGYRRARRVSRRDPAAGVEVAFDQLRDTASAALVIKRRGRVSNDRRRLGFAALRAVGPGDAESEALVDELAQLYVQARHSSGARDITREAADSYINACENYDDVIRTIALSQLRHPSGHHEMAPILAVLGMPMAPSVTPVTPEEALERVRSIWSKDDPQGS